MYYEESVIDGCLHYRTGPNDTWIKYSEQSLTSRIKKLDAQLAALSPTWSEKRPTEAGQRWWYRRLPDIEPRVYEIHEVFGTGRLVTQNGWEVDRLSEDGGEWAGPLVLPREA